MSAHFRLLSLLLSALLVPACGDDGDTIIQQVASTVGGASSSQLVVLGQSNELFWVNPATPGTVLGSVQVWGLTSGTTLQAISYRISNGQLYGRGSDGSLYRIRTSDGFAQGVGFFPFGIVGTFLGLDFSPVADVLRYVTDEERNGRIDPSNNFPSPDTPLAPAGTVVACAYTNNVAGAATTTLFAIDAGSNELVRIGGVDGVPSPNAGAVTSVGPLGVTLSISAGPPFRGTGFDISPAGTAYAALCVVDGSGSMVTSLYTVNLATGAATSVGALGAGGPIRSMSIVP